MSDLIHIFRHEKQEGPYSVQRIQEMLAEGSVTQSTLAWKEGMEQWAPLAEILPSLAGESSHAPRATSGQAISISHPGIGRLVFFCVWVGLVTTGLILQTIFSADPRFVSSIRGLILISICILTVSRLKNMGKSGWWAALIFIPLVNLCVGAFCLAAPPGYAQSKKMDTTGNVILWTIAGLIALMVAWIYLTNL